MAKLKHGVEHRGSGIYLITNKVNGKIYVGSSIHVAKRIREHIRALRHGSHHNRYLQRSWNEHGEASFSYSLLCICERNEMQQKENDLIASMKADDPAVGYNIIRMDVHDGVAKSAIISKKLKDYWEANPEQRKVVSEKRLAVRMANAEPTTLVDPNGVSHTFKNRREFARTHNLNHICLYWVIKGRQYHHKGWTTDKNRMEDAKLDFKPKIKPSG